jgi:F-type H+-transporting ATPase subunit delta
MGRDDQRAEAYADVLFEVARAEGTLEEVEDELFRFSRTLDGSHELRQALTDQAVPADKRQAIVEDLLGDKASPTTVNLISFVIGAGRGRQLPDIVGRLVERAAAERQREVAEVRAAVPLDDDQQDRLREALSAATGKQVEVKVVVDESVMGGLVARVGDIVIDGTVRHRLDHLKERL